MKFEKFKFDYEYMKLQMEFNYNIESQTRTMQDFARIIETRYMDPYRQSQQTVQP